MPYGLDLDVDEKITRISIFDVVARLKAGNPPIWNRVMEGESWITINAFGLKEGEDSPIGERIAGLFTKGGSSQADGMPEAITKKAGTADPPRTVCPIGLIV